MNEEKTLKHWLKRKASFSQALLVVFLITGGISFAATLEELEGRIKTLEEKQVRYISIKPDAKAASGNENNNGAEDPGAIAIGQNAIARGNSALVIGLGAESYRGIAIGKAATSHLRGLAIGNEAKARYQGIAMGLKTEAMGQGSIAIGLNAMTGGDLTNPDFAAQDAIAIGTGAKAPEIEGNAIGSRSAAVKYAVAFGSDSYAGGEKGIALGSKSNTSAEGGVALGYASVANREAFTTTKKPSFSTFDLNGNTSGAVSVGSSDKLRQIINVAEATEATDAVNLRQLEGAVNSVKVTLLEKKPHYFHVNSTATEPGSNHDNDGAVGRDSMAIGANVRTLGNNSIALGDSVKNLGNESLAIGKNISSAGTASTVIGISALSVIAKEEDGISVDEYNAKSEEEKKEYVPLYGYGGPVKYYKNEPGTNTAAANVAIGHYSRAFGQDNVAIGVNSLAKERGSVALGFGSEALKSGAISLGISAAAEGGNSIAMGGSSKVAGEYSTGIGFQTTVASGYSIVMGYDSLSYAGKESEAKTSTQYKALSDAEKKEYVQYLGDYKYYKITPEGWNVAIGQSSKAFGQQIASLGAFTNVKEFGGVALGAFSESNVERGVALGHYSLANRAAFQSKTIAPFSEIDLNGQTMGAVSVGREGKLRQIINVGDGTKATDAVNLRQLQAVHNKITDDANANLTGKADTNLGNITDDGKQVITNLIQVVGDGKIQVSSEENPDSKQKTFKVSLDTETMNQINKEESVSAAKDSMITVAASKTNTTGGKDFALDLTKETKDKINSIGTGVIEVENKNTVTGGAVFDYVKDQIGNATGNSTIAYKADEEPTPKTVKTSEGFHFQGDDNIKIASADKGVLNYRLNSNLSGIESISNGDTKVTLGKDKTVDFGGSKLTNLGEGEVSATSTDAVTGSQLHATNEKVEENTAAIQKGFDTTRENSYQIAKVRNEVGHVGSLSAALAALNPMEYDPMRRNQVLAGVGHYRNKQAIAVGMSHHFTENFRVTAGVSIGNENRVKTMANLGFAWKIGKEEEIHKLPERYQDGPIGTVYIMQKEMETVLKENKEQKARIDKLEKQVELLLNSK